MNTKRKMPCKAKIKKYWEGKFRFIEDFGWEELPIDACWRCGQKGYVERAHITPRFNGGDDSASNLHLLCGQCHRSSEFMTNFEPDSLYYMWFYSTEPFWESTLFNIVKKMAERYDKDMSKKENMKFLVKEIYNNQDNIYGF